MKKILLIAVTLFFTMPSMQAQDEDGEVKIVLVKEENSDNYYYEGVVPVDGVTKEEMFRSAKDWVLSTVKTEDNNAKFDDQELSIFTTPTIVVKAINGRNNDFVNFKLKLMFKDGKYKFRFDNLIVKSNVFLNSPPTAYNGVKMVPGGGARYNRRLINVINQTLFDMAASLEKTIKGTGVKKDDW